MGGNLFGSLLRVSNANFGYSEGAVAGIAQYEAAPSSAVPSASYRSSYYSPIPTEDFASEVEDRKVTKSSDISTEVERGKFKEAESKVINIVSSSSSFLLNQNVNRYGKDKKSYYMGWFQIKVETSKYDSVVTQLKDIGEVTSFGESREDVTGTYKNLNIEIQSDKSRLQRYQQLFDSTNDIQQKITLTDRIFDQERKIKYLEESLLNIDKRVEYSTINLNINEKKSDYVDIIFVKFSELIKGFVGSVNLLLKFVFVIVPWAFAVFVILFLYKSIKKKCNKEIQIGRKKF